MSSDPNNKRGWLIAVKRNCIVIVDDDVAMPMEIQSKRWMANIFMLMGSGDDGDDYDNDEKSDDDYAMLMESQNKR